MRRVGLLLVFIGLGPQLGAQPTHAPAAPPVLRTRVACRVWVVEKGADTGLTTRAPLVTRAVTATGASAGESSEPFTVPAHWTWWVEPEVPPTFDGSALAMLVEDLAESAIPALSLAGCVRLVDQDLAPLRQLRDLRQLDLSGCSRLTAAALPPVLELPELAWLQVRETGIATKSVTARLTRRIDERVERALTDEGLVGVAVAIVVDGRLAHAQGYGLADREAGLPVSPSTTLFRWASISKPVTAVAALRLAERGKLTLDADVRHWVPEFPAKPYRISACQLLTHQGGIVHYENGPVVRTERAYDVPHPFADVVLALDTFKESPLVCEPGSRHSYTTHGFMLLGAVVQRAGGAAFWQQVQESIAEPLGMTTFQPDYEWVAIPGRTQGYRKVAGEIVRANDGDVSWKLPGGGFTSCVIDLARFAQGLLRGALLQPATQAVMFTRQHTRDGKSTGYGLGIGVGSLDGVECVSHSGAQDKTRTMLLVFPSRQLAVAVMTNSEWADVIALARDLARIVLAG